MSEHGIPEGAVSRADIAELAAWFDRFENAFDPLSLAAKEAESEFEDRVFQLYRDKVAAVYSSVSFPAFASRVRSLCRVHLRKNVN